MGAFLGLSLVYFYSHYFFASNTAHVSAMYAPFLGVALVVGTPPLLAALVLAFFSNLFSSMTHYGTGPAPVLFGAGYVEVSDWWRLGFIVSLVNLVIWLGRRKPVVADPGLVVGSGSCLNSLSQRPVRT